MATFFGSDTSCISDLPLINVQITDPRILIAQRLARRLTTARGALASINDDPSFGWDVRQYINAKLSPSTRGIAEQQITSECLKDEQVQSVIVQVVQSGDHISVSVSAVSAVGPFALTLNVSELTVDLVFSPQ